MKRNGTVIEAEIAWFRRVVDRRLDLHARDEQGDVVDLVPAPNLAKLRCPYADAVGEAGLSPAERVILMLALLPHVRPQALDTFLIQNQATKRRFTEFGGADSGPQSGFVPTRETALFVLGGEDIAQRFAALRLIDAESPLRALRILDGAEDSNAPWTPLAISQRWLDRVTTGRSAPLASGPLFPAQLLETPYVFEDLVVGPAIHEALAELLAWVRNERLLMEDWGLSKHLKPGYRALFHGPPGTGKTMTAAVLGKTLGLPVYRVDLSRVVSKWVGETEKNLGALFDQAAHGDMLLFFDEADALFGKRGDTQTANDRHANQQIAYLLQRIEESPGVVILASNLKANIDAAFARRFQAMVYFPMPDAAARLKLWQMVFAEPRARLAEGVPLDALARRYELSGGEMINILRRVSVHALIEGDSYVADARITDAVARELAGSGRVAG
ncbi:AAA family ATPase [Sphingomonas gei]|uniref:AAA family ATPase n=1 Tax=Sphingomonas gei TaxID=1395960 RepID=A0A4V3QZF5_9SPHN|nr:ATP-binding protein [Sphingomonas gei]TGX54122.1 AAA family ATPase [Sphingomonas gei]